MWKMRGPVVRVIALTNFPRRRRTPPAMASMPSRREPSNTFYSTFVHQVLCEVIAIGRNRGVSFFPRQTCQAAAKIGKIDKASKLSDELSYRIRERVFVLLFSYTLYSIIFTFAKRSWKRLKRQTSNAILRKNDKSLMILESSLLACMFSSYIFISIF